jgi:hypothetical protein
MHMSSIFESISDLFFSLEGGARLVSEEEISAGNRVTQGWSLRCLGGKPLRCDGLKIVFFPVAAEKATGSSEAVTSIELTIQKTKPKTAANIKRTPFEEENYIASAWSRPMNLPLSRGPRTLRVLGPMPELLVKDVTEEETGGKAVEGTVNRILLRLTAGQKERCNNLKYKISCFSVLVTPGGSTRRLVSEQEVTSEPGTSADMKNPAFRTPTLVSASKDSKSSQTDYGYTLPDGWNIAGEGNSYAGSPCSVLQDGGSTFIQLNFFRPPPSTQNPTLLPNDENIGDVSVCKTDFYVTISYDQQRPLAQKRSMAKRSSRRRRASAKPGDTGESSSGEPEKKAEEQKAVEALDEVSLEFSGSVVWEKPLSATFNHGPRTSLPSGNLHESNTTDNLSDDRNPEAELCLSEGESSTTRCTLQTDDAIKGLKAEIYSIRFEDATDSEKVSLGLLSGTAIEKSGILYSPQSNDPCRILSLGSKLSVAYTVKPTLHRVSVASGTRAELGIISVDWKPSSLQLPDDLNRDSVDLGGYPSHGPLRLQSPSTIRFPGPLAFIERSPFEATIDNVPAAPRIGHPFGVTYNILNKTPLGQIARVNVVEPSEDTGLLFAGMVSGELTLAPSESQSISYTFLATRAGKVRLPSLEVSSERYKSWIIKEPTQKAVYIFP